MRVLIFLLLLTSFAFSKYEITYNNLKLGEINSFDTLKQNYFKIKITNSIAKFLLNSKYMVFYNEEYNGIKNEKNIKYKKDKYQLINLINKAINNEIKTSEKIVVKNNKNKFINIEYKDKYYFKYHSKGKIKTKGYLDIRNNEFISLVEENNNIKIVRK